MEFKKGNYVRPVHPCEKSKKWVRGEIIEAFDGCRWQVGKIAKVLKNNKFVIKLMGSVQLKQFHQSYLRTRKGSADGNWSEIRKVAQIKQTLLPGIAIPDKLNTYSRPFWSTDDNDQYSVASCSSNEFAVYPNENFIKFDSSDAESSVPSRDITCELEADVRRLELHAYKSTMQALYALGPLSWEQESLLTNLRLSLHISDDDHLLHLRHLMSAQVL
ncbi:hypothetical protein ACFE04_016143 [Oxalis oulophora]